MDDERLRAFVKEELDRREAEAQSLCLHLEGTIPPGCDVTTVRCNSCGKVIVAEDLDAPGSGQPSTPHMGRYHHGSVA